MVNVWTLDEVRAGAELIQRMSSAEAADRLSEMFGRRITAKALLGKLHRDKIVVKTFNRPRTVGNKNPRPRINDNLMFGPKQKKTSIVSKRTFVPVIPRVYGAPTGESAGISTCQYIEGLVPNRKDFGSGKSPSHKCGQTSNGPWCDKHLSVVFKERDR